MSEGKDRAELEFTVVINAEPDGHYYGHVKSRPSVMGDGPTPDACVLSVVKSWLATSAYIQEQALLGNTTTVALRAYVDLTAQSERLREAAKRG
jgi:predicted RNase H-like HicB family nuclease